VIWCMYSFHTTMVLTQRTNRYIECCC